MSWEDEQDRFTLETRLNHSSPEVVYQELRKMGLEVIGNRFWKKFSQPGRGRRYDDRLEISLIERNEQLINLGLATGLHPVRLTPA
jgi:hypothetical protein